MGPKQVMVFPFTVPMDGGGQMRDAAQGVYARSLARTLAERLSVGPAVAATASAALALRASGATATLARSPVSIRRRVPRAMS